MVTRGAARRTAASAEPAQSASAQSTQQASTPPELPKKKATKPKAKPKGKAAAANVESHTVVQAQSAVITSSATASSSVARISGVRRTTRARAARPDTTASPIHTGLVDPEKVLKRKHTADRRSATATPEPAQNENIEEQGLFFSKIENEKLRKEISELRARITQLEETNASLVAANTSLVSENSMLRGHGGSPASTSCFFLSSSLQASNRPFPQPLFSKPVSPQLSQTVSQPLFSQPVSPHIVVQTASLQLSQTASSLLAFEPVSTEVVVPTDSPHPVSVPDEHIPTRVEQYISEVIQLRTSQVSANSIPSEFDSDMMHIAEASSPKPTFVNGNKSAMDLLHKLEAAAKVPVQVDSSFHENGETFSNNDVTTEGSSQNSAQNPHISQSLTPSRAIASPSGFFGRSMSALSALKNKLGFSTPNPQAPHSAVGTSDSPNSSRAIPTPSSFTESLSVPPTPIGERTKKPSRKKKTDTMLKVLLRGVEQDDKQKAEAWAKHAVPELKNDRAYNAKRKRLETPVLIRDLKHFPSSKPWSSGFGDPLADMDDDDVVPVWAVYLDMITEDEERKTKKAKTNHEITMDVDDTVSINEQFAANNSAHLTSKLHDSHGHSTSPLDFHPRRSIDPSPMFETPVSHKKGSNVFNELQGHNTAAQIRATDSETLQKVTNKTVHIHNPEMGSFSVPDDSDEEDSSVVGETSETGAAPLWTQPPPPAPVPAHAPLPGGPAPDASSITGLQQPVDEIERQRQKLMKHTPAKPSRLREATYPSPSFLSDAGNESILAGTPLAASKRSIFDDMPQAELIELNEEEQAELDEIVNSKTYKQQQAATQWPAPIITYDESEEDVSPV